MSALIGHIPWVIIIDLLLLRKMKTLQGIANIKYSQIFYVDSSQIIHYITIFKIRFLYGLALPPIW